MVVLFVKSSRHLTDLDKHCIVFSLIITDKGYISRHISHNVNKVKENFEYFKSCILKKECCYPINLLGPEFCYAGRV